MLKRKGQMAGSQRQGGRERGDGEREGEMGERERRERARERESETQCSALETRCSALRRPPTTCFENSRWCPAPIRTWYQRTPTSVQKDKYKEDIAVDRYAQHLVASYQLVGGGRLGTARCTTTPGNGLYNAQYCYNSAYRDQNAALYTVQYSDGLQCIQYSTVEYSTVQCSTSERWPLEMGRTSSRWKASKEACAERTHRWMCARSSASAC
eukprot:669973-Rhodomonas_salina.1